MTVSCILYLLSCVRNVRVVISALGSDQSTSGVGDDDISHSGDIVD